MGKQTFYRVKKTLIVLLLVSLTVSFTAALVSAFPSDGKAQKTSENTVWSSGNEKSLSTKGSVCAKCVEEQVPSEKGACTKFMKEKSKGKYERCSCLKLERPARELSFESYSNPGYFIRYVANGAVFKGEISHINSPEEQSQSNFLLIDGLADSTYVTFEPTWKAGYYLRHSDYRVYLDPRSASPLYLEDATFKEVPGLASNDPNLFSYQSFNYPNRYLRQQDFHLWVHDNDGTDTFKRDATFRKIYVHP